MLYVCDYCDGQPAEWAWETSGRGWKVVCEGCYHGLTPIIQMYCEPLKGERYYPTFDYATRTVR